MEFSTMALGKVSKFAAFAARECAVIEAIQTAPPAPQEPTAHELRARRKAAKKALRDLSTATPDQIEFAAPAGKAATDLSELELAMREALGLGRSEPAIEAPVPAPVASPVELLAIIPATFGNTDAARDAARMRELEKQTRAVLNLPDAEAQPQEQPKPKPEKPRQFVKRRIEVILNVRNSMGAIVPFYHVDPSSSRLEAEINANRKAKGYGLTVLETRQINEIEAIIDAEAPKAKAGRRTTDSVHAAH